MDETLLTLHLSAGDCAVIIASLCARVGIANATQDARGAYYAEVLDRFDTQVIDGIISHGMGVTL
jgi:hypothetical protein